jgi:hypothetical protein
VLPNEQDPASLVVVKVQAPVDPEEKLESSQDAMKPINQEKTQSVWLGKQVLAEGKYPLVGKPQFVPVQQKVMVIAMVKK